METREILERLASELPQDELREAWEEWVEIEAADNADAVDELQEAGIIE